VVSHPDGFDGAKLGQWCSYTYRPKRAEPVPEPSSVLGILAIWCLYLGHSLKKIQEKQINMFNASRALVWLLTNEKLLPQIGLVIDFQQPFCTNELDEWMHITLGDIIEEEKKAFLHGKTLQNGVFVVHAVALTTT